MAWRVSALFERFREAVSWFQQRMPVTRERLAQLDAQAAQRAWWVSSVAEAEVVRQVHDSLTKAIDTGVPFEEWEREIETTLVRAWGGPKAGRVEVIFRNAAQHAYQAGRHYQMTRPGLASRRPYWKFDAVRDTRTTPVCREADGTILPSDHPWWTTHHPPLHHQCRSGVLSLTTKQAAEEGITPAPTTLDSQDGFGATPTLDDWDPDLDRYDPDTGAALQRKLRQPPDRLVPDHEE